MIKVNLAKGMTAGAPAAVGDSGAPATEERTGDSKTALINFGLMIIFLAVAFGLSQYLKSTKEQEFVVINQQLQNIQSELSGFNQGSAEFKNSIETMKKTDEAFADLKVIAEDRLIAIKILDAIQSLVPDKTWIRAMKLEKGTLNIQGFSMVSEGLPLLMKALDESVFFSGISVVTTSQEKTSDGDFNKFEINCSVGSSAQKL